MTEDDPAAKRPSEAIPEAPGVHEPDNDLNEVTDLVFHPKPVSRGTIKAVLKYRGRGKPKLFSDDFDFVEPEP